MGILRKLPAGLGERGTGEEAESAAWESMAPPGTAAASAPPEAARNSLRSIEESLAPVSIRVTSAAQEFEIFNKCAAELYAAVTDKQVAKIVFLKDALTGMEEVLI